MLSLSSPVVYLPTIFITIVLVFVSILYRDAKKNTHEHTKDLPYYNEIGLSMGYIGRSILENGRFQYQKNIDETISYDNKIYNSLRHAGTLYSMYMYEKYGLEKRYHDLRILCSNYFMERYLKGAGKNSIAVISIPEEEQIKFPIAKTGATGVALCALANLYEEKAVSIEFLRGMGNFLLSMTSEEGNVYAYYDVEKKEINRTAEALFYPAEAACGLLYLYEVDPQNKWLDTAKKIIMNIISSRQKLEMGIPFDHWSVLAIEKLMKMKLLTPAETNLVQSYAEQMVIPMLSEQITNSNNIYYGAFKDNVRPCSIGTILEGFASVYECSNNNQLKEILFKAIAIGSMFLAKVQVKTGVNAGGMPNSANWLRPGVTPNASIIRIDNVQHVVTGWLKFQRILKNTGNF